MDKLSDIHKAHGEWPQAVDLKETGFSVNDPFSPALIEMAIELARKNPRKRAIVRVHETLSSEQHLMVNAILGESYVPPHKHEEAMKTEIFRLVKGRAFVVFFDNEGNIVDKIAMDDSPDGRKIVVVRPGRWHTFVPMSSETVVLEAKRQPKGGYDPKTDKTMASWAPKPEDVESANAYLSNLVNQLDNSV